MNAAGDFEARKEEEEDEEEKRILVANDDGTSVGVGVGLVVMVVVMVVVLVAESTVGRVKREARTRGVKPSALFGRRTRTAGWLARRLPRENVLHPTISMITQLRKHFKAMPVKWILIPTI
ncbi:hypothetical protein M0804_005986 [Polistes exclamans]|nr:hypothetical protein M0804_005986 [Polistes exclamans]